MRIISVLFFCFVSIKSFAQPNKNLYLVNPNNGKERLIKEGRIIKVTLNDSTVHKGRFYVLDESNLCIVRDTLNVNDFTDLQVSTNPDRWGAVLGGTLPTLLFVTGIISDLANVNDEYFGYGLIMASIAATPTAFAWWGFFYGRTRSVEKGWTYVIR